MNLLKVTIYFSVYQGLIRTCSHAIVLETESSTDPTPITNFKKEISYKNYMDFWSGLLNSVNNKVYINTSVIFYQNVF